MNDKLWRLIYKDNVDSAVVYIPICKLGNYLTEGSSSLLRIIISDTEIWNDIWDKLHMLSVKSITFDTVFELEIENEQYTLDLTLWPKLYNLLTMFFMNLDTNSTNNINM